MHNIENQKRTKVSIFLALYPLFGGPFTQQKILTFVLFLALAFLAPTFSFAAIPQYANIESLRQSNVIVQYGPMAKKFFYNCSLTTFSCAKTIKEPTISFPLKTTKTQKLLVSSDASKGITVETKTVDGALTYITTIYKNVKGKAVKVGTVPMKYKAYTSLWSADYSKVALYSTDYVNLPEDVIRISVFDADKLTFIGETTIETKYAFGYTLSPRGDMIAFYNGSREANGKMRSFSVIDIVGNKTYSISEPVDYWDLVADQPRIFQFSPDGKTLVYVNDKEDPMTLYTVDLDAMKQTGVMTGTRLFPGSQANFSDFVFIGGSTLAYVANSKENPYDWALMTYNFSSKVFSTITHNLAYTSRILREGKFLFVSKIENNTSVPYVYNIETKVGKYFAQLKPSTVKLPGTRSVIDVNGMKGVLVKPKNGITASTPLFIWLHGGPYRQTSYGYHSYGSYGVYDWMLDEMVKKDVAVLKLDYRGSLGYGRIFSSSIKNEVGKGDVTDVMNAIAKVKADNPTLQNVYLVGNSYGGYLTLKTIVEHPNEIAGGFSINGVTDWGELLIPLKTSIFNTHFNGVPNESNAALYNQASILNKIWNLPSDKPIVIAQGSSDRTVNPAQATLLDDALKASGKMSTLVKYKGQDHVFSSASVLEDLCKRLITMAGKTTAGACSFK